jgi:ATP-dependent RNA helicase HelY
VAAKLVTLRVKATRRGQRDVDPKVEQRAVALEERARAHPCHACPDRARHERWAARASALKQQMQATERRIKVRTETLARQFDRVLAVLGDLGYVDGWAVTERGRTLTRIYGEGDLLVGEAIATGLFEGLSASECAALLSAVVYEARERQPLSGGMPTQLAIERLERLERIWRRVRRIEDTHQVQLSRELEVGFATPVFHWAEGKPLEDVLAETEMAPGDFVRNCKQLVDLLRQIEDVAPQPTANVARGAREAVLRGVVAYTGV